MTSRSIHLAATDDGALTYLVDLGPEALPPVRSADLDDAWAAARTAADRSDWGPARYFRFRRADGDLLDLALADPDACCWAQAVDQLTGLASPYGLSLCLRLLALVDLLARVPALRPLCRLRRTGAALHPTLLRTAAIAPLTSQAAFDERAFHHPLALPTLSPSMSGANA